METKCFWGCNEEQKVNFKILFFDLLCAYQILYYIYKLLEVRGEMKDKKLFAFTRLSLFGLKVSF